MRRTRVFTYRQHVARLETPSVTHGGKLHLVWAKASAVMRKIGTASKQELQQRKMGSISRPRGLEATQAWRHVHSLTLWEGSIALAPPRSSHLFLNSTMATGMTGSGENFDPAYETFRKHSADLLTIIQDPEVLAWELYAQNIISPSVRDAVNNVMHERGQRTSNLLGAVDSRIAVDPDAFDVFLSVLAKRPSMIDLWGRMKETYGKSVRQADILDNYNTPSGLSLK